MKVVNQVNSTTDYSLFSSIAGNRKTNALHIERLKNSFRNEYLLSPILVNQKYQIIDGQHRFNAAKALGLPINFIIVNDYGLKEVQLLNTNMKNWRKEDYLQAYCDLGYQAYIEMRKFMQAFPDFGVSICEAILTNNTGGANNKAEIRIDKQPAGNVLNFQEGKLYIPDIKKSYEYAEKIIALRPYYSGYNRRCFILAILSLFKNANYDHSQMVSKLKLHPNSLVDCSNVTQYKVLIEEVYNFKSREKVSLRY